MNWLQTIIFGIISGISEFLPISAHAHRKILLWLFGVDGIDPLRDLIVHIAVAAALILAMKSMSEIIFRPPNGSRGYNRMARGNRDARLIRTATSPMLLVFLVLSYITRSIPVPLMSLFLLINGVILYLPDRMLHGNKDARYMTRAEGIMLGLAGAATALTGISGLALILFVAAARGAHRTHGVNWGLQLCLPILILQILIDIFTIFINLSSITLSAGFLGYLFIALFAFVGAYLAVKLVRILSARTGFLAFSYYSWGLALFTFILYLI